MQCSVWESWSSDNSTGSVTPSPESRRKSSSAQPARLPQQQKSSRHGLWAERKGTGRSGVALPPLLNFVSVSFVGFLALSLFPDPATVCPKDSEVVGSSKTDAGS